MDVPISLWGLRLGALLALDFAKDRTDSFDKIILWQPVINGESFLTQFLRLRLANEMLSRDNSTPKGSGTHAMRSTLANGETLEVAGYELAPELAAAIDSLKAAELVITRSPVHWFEIVAEPDRPMTAAGARVVSGWKQDGVDLHVHLVPGLPFWATPEISECTELVSATTNVFADSTL
jgi:exosortase A-associated hydrolase 2